jgi:hypothetical protein
MAKATGTASIRTLERLHRNVAKGLNLELERAIKAKEPIGAALLNAAVAMLKTTGVVEPKRARSKVDRLAGLLEGYEADADDAPATDASVDFSTTLPERDSTAAIPRHPSRAFDD